VLHINQCPSEPCCVTIGQVQYVLMANLYGVYCSGYVRGRGGALRVIRQKVEQFVILKFQHDLMQTRKTRSYKVHNAFLYCKLATKVCTFFLLLYLTEI
jgi:hypothetical protein